MPNNKNYKTLDLADKVKVIRLYEKTGKGSRALAAEFNVGKTQIQGILKRKPDLESRGTKDGSSSSHAVFQEESIWRLTQY